MDYVPVQTSAHVNTLTVDGRPQQYVAIPADQLGVHNSRGEVMISYAAIPVQQSANNVGVQHSPLVLPAGHQTVLTNQNQFNTFTRNVINSPVAVTQTSSNALPSNVVPVNSIAQLPSQQANVPQISPVALQSNVQPQLVRLVPVSHGQTMVNSSNSFSNAPTDQSHPVTSSCQLSQPGNISTVCQFL